MMDMIRKIVGKFEDDGSDKEEAGETSDTGMEEDIETTHVSAAKKRKKKYRGSGAESRKKRLLFQRSSEKYRDIEEEMKGQAPFISDSGGARADTRTRVVLVALIRLYSFCCCCSYSLLLRLLLRVYSCSVPTPTSTRTTVTAPSRSRAPATSQTGGPANAAKTRSQTKVSKK
ncbi:hypothetical protein Bca101_022095 [Brassica carinata]